MQVPLQNMPVGGAGGGGKAHQQQQQQPAVGNIIVFYNQIFVPAMKSTLVLIKERRCAAPPPALLAAAGLDVYSRFGRSAVWVAVRPRGTRLAAAAQHISHVTTLGRGERLVTIKRVKTLGM
jgi:hypothetical protein